MVLKQINGIYQAPAPHMVGDGFRVHNIFPGGNRIAKKMSPFYLFDYNAPYPVPPGEKQKGVGVHPHRGFETVTIALQGAVAHHDSAGNEGTIAPGDVQWMTAGSGVLHKEYHEKNFSKKGGMFEMIQLWVNLPSKHKMTTPQYQSIKLEDQGKKVLADNAGELIVIAGSCMGVKGPATTFTPINLARINVQANQQIEFEIPESHQGGIFCLHGEAEVNNEVLKEKELACFDATGKLMRVHAQKNVHLLLMSGEAINEPIAQYGPFLMNTPEELQQAMEDFNQGKFGQLAD